MAYAFIHDLPIDADTYDRIEAEIANARPDGLIVHVVARRDGGLRYVDVWESEEHWQKFHEGTVHPALDRVFADGWPDPSGIRMEELEVYRVDRG